MVHYRVKICEKLGSNELDVSGIAGAGKSHLLRQLAAAAFSMGKSIAILSPTDASVKDLRKTGFQARTFQGQTNSETVTLERNGQVRQFKPSAKGKWDVLVSSTMEVNVGDRIRVTAGFREGKNVFKNNDVAQVREITDTELVLHDGRRMRHDGARIDQGVCITS
jgi:hypothetical protein